MPVFFYTLPSGGPLRRGYLLQLIATAVVLLPFACRPADAPPRTDYAALSAFTEGGIHMVVEIPAGTNRKVEYQTAGNEFVVDRIGGTERIIRFLPYPGNYGFIPATLMDKERGGDGDALDVLLLSESLPTGTVVEALPIAALRLEDQGEVDTKIIAVPLDSARRIIDVTRFRDFLIQYDGAKRILEEWFLYYEGLGGVQLLGWEDERYALEEIRRWAK